MTTKGAQVSKRMLPTFCQMMGIESLTTATQAREQAHQFLAALSQRGRMGVSFHMARKSITQMKEDCSQRDITLLKAFARGLMTIRKGDPDYKDQRLLRLCENPDFMDLARMLSHRLDLKVDVNSLPKQLAGRVEARKAKNAERSELTRPGLLRTPLRATT